MLLDLLKPLRNGKNNYVKMKNIANSFGSHDTIFVLIRIHRLEISNGLSIVEYLAVSYACRIRKSEKMQFLDTYREEESLNN